MCIVIKLFILFFGYEVAVMVVRFVFFERNPLIFVDSKFSVKYMNRKQFENQKISYVDENENNYLYFIFCGKESQGIRKNKVDQQSKIFTINTIYGVVFAVVC